MNAGKAVYGILSGTTAVTDIVGTRIFPEIAEQEAATPFIVYQLQSVAPEDTHDGPSKLDEVRFEFLCYADSYNQAADLADKVRGALDRVSGTYNGVNVESVQFNDVDVEIEYDPRRYSQVLKFTFRIKRDDFTIAQGTPVTGAQLGQLADVDVDGVTTGQVIAYNSHTQNWEAADDAGGAENLGDLNDVTLTSPQAGTVLQYNGTFWNAASLSIPSVPSTYYHNRYESEAETLLDGATDTVELYYTAQADGDGLHEDAQTDTAQSGYDIRRKLYYAEKAQADPNTSGDWTQFADIADDTTYASAKATLLAYLKARTGGTVPISLKMTWEEVAESTLLLDNYTGAEAAYSLRQLRTGETEAVRVRRASDNAEQTIGFSSGELDTTALATFCGSSNGFVKTWFDQSGNNNDATQTTTANQPKIYDGTTGVLTENGKPIISNISGSGASTLLIGTQITTSTTHVFGVAELDGTVQKVLIGIQAGAGFMIAINNSSDAAGQGTGLHINGASSSITTRGQVMTQFQNQTLFSTTYDFSPAGFTQTRIGMQNPGGAAYKMFNMQELVFFGSDQSSNRSGIHDNINTFYSIY